MKNLIPILALALLAGCAARASTPPQAGPGRPPPAEFPADWIGSWQGPIAIATPDGPGLAVTMGLTIAATDDPDRYEWTITYASAEDEQVRPYELVAIDAAKGAWAIDEHNGIVLDARFLNGALFTWFDVTGARITVREQLVHPGTADEAISFELLFASDEPTPGGTSDFARSFVPHTVQNAMLRRVP